MQEAYNGAPAKNTAYACNLQILRNFDAFQCVLGDAGTTLYENRLWYDSHGTCE